MNYNYSDKGLFLQVTFPTRSVKVAMFRYEDIRLIKEEEKDGKSRVTIAVKNAKDDKVSDWIFDGTLEEFKKNCETVRL
jgi:hypothetical protein